MISKTNARRFRLSPALVISCVALFLTLGGTALALPHLSVRSAQIVDGTVRTVDLRDNAVRAAKIAPDSVSSEEIAENAVASPEVAPDSLAATDLGAASVTSSEVADQSLTANDLGPDSIGSSEIAASSVGSSELGTVTVRSSSEPIAKDANGTVSVSCAAGEQVLSGGGQPGHFGVEMTSTRPSGNGWLYQAKNNTNGASTITAFAVCLG
jgi:trimeric autotransporter adhesin